MAVMSQVPVDGLFFSYDTILGSSVKNGYMDRVITLTKAKNYVSPTKNSY
jgi:hypothetical protein